MPARPVWRASFTVGRGGREHQAVRVCGHRAPTGPSPTEKTRSSQGLDDPGYQFQRGQECADGGPMPDSVPGGSSRGAVQVAEHVAEFVRHAGRRRNGPGSGGSGPGLPPGARRADESRPAETQFGHRMPGDRQRPAGGKHAGRRVCTVQARGVCRGQAVLRRVGCRVRRHRFGRSRFARRGEPETPRHRQHADGPVRGGSRAGGRGH